MAKLFASFLVLLSVCTLGCNLVLADDTTKTFCVAKPSTDDTALKNNIAFLQNSGIKLSEPCSKPSTNINIASVLMNSYYQANGRNAHNCDFADSGLITLTDPSYSSCKYAYNSTI
ncbi:Carbohydrate-binding X8 domain superfamily protein [Striga hermonthica]|uniref:Carbohydrate-binding X8 domain superfamily protein n=1 Tax=Striga hermonthica TaxID=68872 RepID=A0A9N7MMQ4_STRHE|nr:Carbohydrate-binding X8 domain superfamily protein [Striga hermonthica]